MKIEPPQSKYCKINIEVAGQKTEIFDIYSDSFKFDIEELGGVNFINLHFDEIKLVPFDTLQEIPSIYRWFNTYYYSFYSIYRQYKKISFNINKLIKPPYFENIIVIEDGQILQLNCNSVTSSHFHYVYETIEESQKSCNVKKDKLKAEEEKRKKEDEEEKRKKEDEEVQKDNRIKEIKETKDKLLDVLYKRAMEFFK